jgi:intracellular multiplication protein IcmG
MTTKNKFQDEEYQFPQDEYVDEIHAEPEAAPEEAEEQPLMAEASSAVRGGLANIWSSHKRIITIVGVLVVVSLTFTVMRSLHKSGELPAAPTQTAPVAAAPTVQTMVDPQVIDQLTSLKQDAATNSAVVRQLQGQVQDLNNSLNQTRASQQQLNQSLMILVGQVQQLTTEVKVLAQPKPVKVAVAAPKAKPVPVITFQIRAVVPGRAWIVGSDGQSQSVAVGDHVPQYGSVQSIDADAGVVLTTSGKTIKF